MGDDQLDCALDLMRRMPPTNIEDNLAGLIDLVPDLTEDLLSAVDQPLKVSHDKEFGRDYLLCDYNRDGDSYRSPWSNKYDPKLPDGALPSKKLREIEVQANEAFDVYRDLYYEGGVSSVYCWDIDDGFAACVLIKKVGEQHEKRPIQGVWDSIHVVEVNEKGKTANYKLTSTVMLSMTTENKDTGSVNLCGSLTRQSETDFPVTEENAHIVNMGKIIEDMEQKLRNALEIIYFGKTHDIVNEIRAIKGVEEAQRRKQSQMNIVSTIMEDKQR
ncbi:f-actin-capping protein subunit beta [Anaeramoeba ignava]|uniref:F-actin-capping protein subunit beta n=1 Tax=Anaeramoeba ignava TaxID=1746090 RepID=A0A9Q0L8I0_ANAIG|nr:f-actin-capping protein subunit beta [Anaeramoeba ignava]